MGLFTLLLGGARSGKSHYAETWAAEHGRQVLFVATAQAFDDEMRERIDAHRAARPPHWTTLETPLNVAHTLRAADPAAHDTLVLDCITLLVSNIMLAQPPDAPPAQVEAAVQTEIDALADVAAMYAARGAQVMFVTNEVGMGVVPPTYLGRLYRDVLGRANQRLAARADRVLLFVAGLAWQLK